MTPYEVTDQLGPPLDVMDMAELVGDSSFAISRSGSQTRIGGKAQRSDLPDTLFWLYLGVPEPGQETDIVFEHGRLSSVKVRPHAAPARDGVEHEWARRFITDHVARMERNHPDLVDGRTAWRTMTGAEVVAFLLDNPKRPSAPGQIQATARRFGDLDVLVSLFDTTDPNAIRSRMPGGYVTCLDSLLRARGIRVGGTDVAHWMLCRAGNQAAVQLAYLPADRSVGAILPADLGSDDERRSR
jgi:hypothetical protein